MGRLSTHSLLFPILAHQCLLALTALCWEWSLSQSLLHTLHPKDPQGSSKVLSKCICLQQSMTQSHISYPFRTAHHKVPILIPTVHQLAVPTYSPYQRISKPQSVTKSLTEQLIVPTEHLLAPVHGTVPVRPPSSPCCYLCASITPPRPCPSVPPQPELTGSAPASLPNNWPYHSPGDRSFGQDGE